MAKNKNIENENVQGETVAKKKMSGTNLFLLIFGIVALVGILTSVVFALIPAFDNKNESLDYLKDDLSDYVSVPKALYDGYTVTVDIPTVTDKEVEYEMLKLLCTHKITPETPVTNLPGVTIGAGDIANIYYRGYTLGEDGTKNYFDGGCNFNDTIYPLEIGSASFIPGFEYNLVGKNQKDYATLTKLTEGNTQPGDIVYLTYSVYYADGQASLAKSALVDLSDPKLDEKWGEGFSAYFNNEKGFSISDQFATGSTEDAKLTVKTVKDTDGDDIYFDMSISSAYRISRDKDPLVVEAYFPYNYGDESLDGKTAYFEVFVKSVKDYGEPELNDEFITEKVKKTAEDLAKYEGETLVAKYKAYVMETLVEQYEEDVKNVVESNFWKGAIAGSTFYKLPEKEVDAAYQNYVAEIESTYASGYSSYYSSLDEFARAYLELGSGADWKATLREDAEYSIKQKLVFYYVIREENKLPNDEEYKALYDELFGEYLQSYLDYYGITEESENYELKVESATKEILSTYGESYWRESVYYEFAIDTIIDMANIVYAN